MFTSRTGRLAALAVLCGALVALVVWFGSLAPDPALNHFPDEDGLAGRYAAHVGERVQVSGAVVETDPVVVAAEYAAWTGTGYETGVMRLTVTDLPQSVAVGQHLQVFGTVRPDRTVAATRAIAVPATNFRYMYTVSFLAGCWVLVRLVRGWTVRWEDLAVRPRRDPLAVVDRLRTTSGPEEEPSDA